MADDYKVWQPDQQPPWLSLTQGEAWGMFWGFLKDGWARASRDATEARYPSRGAPDAVECQAGDHTLERYATESAQQHRQRLAESFDRLQLLGTVQGVIDAAAAVPGVLSVLYREAWEVDPGTPLWARFWVLVRVGWPVAPAFDSGEVWDGGWTWDFEAGDAGPFLVRQIRRWKAAHAKGRVIVCSPDAVVFDQPDLVWDGGWVFDGGQVAEIEV